ncbi:hypothetical protein ACFXTH_026242 [Malus domestica]
MLGLCLRRPLAAAPDDSTALLLLATTNPTLYDQICGEREPSDDDDDDDHGKKEKNNMLMSTGRREEDDIGLITHVNGQVMKPALFWTSNQNWNPIIPNAHYSHQTPGNGLESILMVDSLSPSDPQNEPIEYYHVQ